MEELSSVHARPGSGRRSLLWFAGLFLAFSGFFLWIGPRILPPVNAQDFIQFWVAGKMNWLGLDPYNGVDWLRLRLQYGNDWVPDLVFNYPLPLYRFFAPLGLLPLQVAYRVWDVLNIAMLTGAVVAVLHTYRFPRLERVLFPVVAGMVVFRPVLVTLRNGQLAGFIFFLVVVGALLTSRNRPFWGGVVMGLCMLKPQTGFGILLFFSFWALLNRRWRFLAGAAACELALWGIGWLTNPAWVRIFLSESAAKVDAYSGFSPTLWGLMRFLSGGSERAGWWAALLLGVVLCAGLLWVLAVHHRRLTALEAAALVVPVVLTVTPYTWAYDQIALLLPWTVLTATLARQGRPFLVWGLLVPLGSLAAVLLLLVSARLVNDSFSVLLPLLTFVGLAWLMVRPAPVERLPGVQAPA